MLTPADAQLVDRDPSLAALALVLDGDGLAERLGRPVRRHYLRYKRGTSCVLGLDVDGERCFALVYAEQARVKLDKAVQAAPPGTLLTVDRELLLLVARPAADRDLPALARLRRDLPAALHRVLAGVDVTGATLRTLAHKPQRRWVGRLDVPGAAPVVLRAHRPGDAAATVSSLRVLAGTSVHTCRLLGSDRRRGLVAVSWLPGTPLDELLAGGGDPRGHLRATGAALAELHAGPVAGLMPRTSADDADSLVRAAAAIGVLLPGLHARAEEVVQRLLLQLVDAPGGLVASHGDLSADQVVMTGDGRTGLVDLDAACAAVPELDLGSAMAALHAAAVTGSGLDPAGGAGALLDGYTGAVDQQRLQVQTAAAVLRRAVDPFRSCLPDWPARVEELVARADALAPTLARR